MTKVLGKDEIINVKALLERDADFIRRHGPGRG